MRKSIFVLDVEDAVVAAKINTGETRGVICAHSGAIFLPPEDGREAGGSAGPSVRRIFSH
ncbi:MAG: hypothetical protein WBW73_26350 [Rhodoplanes sp.]